MKCKIQQTKLQLIQKEQMTTLKKTKPIQKTHKKEHNEHKTLILKKHSHSQSNSQSDQDQEEKLYNKAIVDELFHTHHGQIIDEQTKTLQVYEEQEDSNIKHFLEGQSTPYQQEQEEENQEIDVNKYLNEYEEDQISCNNYVAPEYLSMSRFQKHNYFKNLNTSYLQKLQKLSSSKEYQAQAQTQNYTTSTLDKNTNNKLPNQNIPRIKFSQIIYEIAFNKYEQPILIGNTKQQLKEIKFDSTQHDQYQHYHQHINYQINQHAEDEEMFQDIDNKEMNMTSNYFDDDDEASLESKDQKMFNMWLENRDYFQRKDYQDSSSSQQLYEHHEFHSKNKQEHKNISKQYNPQHLQSKRFMQTSSESSSGSRNSSCLSLQLSDIPSESSSILEEQSSSLSINETQISQ